MPSFAYKKNNPDKIFPKEKKAYTPTKLTIKQTLNGRKYEDRESKIQIRNTTVSLVSSDTTELISQCYH